MRAAAAAAENSHTLDSGPQNQCGADHDEHAPVMDDQPDDEQDDAYTRPGCDPVAAPEEKQHASLLFVGQRIQGQRSGARANIAINGWTNLDWA